VKARILPLGDLAEYGKAESAALLISMHPTEAQQILDALSAWTVEDEQSAQQRRSTAVQLIMGYLTVIAGTEAVTPQEAQDAVNTEGRTLLRRNHITDPVNPMQINYLPGSGGPNNISPAVLARRVVEEAATHARNCNCEYHRLARGGR